MCPIAIVSYASSSVENMRHTATIHGNITVAAADRSTLRDILTALKCVGRRVAAERQRSKPKSAGKIIVGGPGHLHMPCRRAPEHSALLNRGSHRARSVVFAVDSTTIIIPVKQTYNECICRRCAV